MPTRERRRGKNKATKRLARRLRRQNRKLKRLKSEVDGMSEVRYAIVTRRSPLMAKLTHANQLLDDEDLVLSQHAKHYRDKTGFRLRDTLVVAERPGGDWLVVAVLSGSGQSVVVTWEDLPDPGAGLLVSGGTLQVGEGFGIDLSANAVAVDADQVLAQLAAGAGLAKAGNTLSVGEGFGVDVSADAVAVDADQVLGQLVAGAGLTKAGNTLSVGEGFGVDVSADAVAVDATQVLGALVAGDGLTKAGNTVDVGAGFGIDVAANTVDVDPSEIAMHLFAGVLVGVTDAGGNDIKGVRFSPAASLDNAIIVQRHSGGGGGGPYGTQQAFLLIKEGTGSVQNALVLARIAGRDGGIGTQGGIHVATGLHRDGGDPAATQSIWVDPTDDCVGLISTAASDSATANHIVCNTRSGGVLFIISPTGTGGLWSRSASDIAGLSFGRGSLNNEGRLVIPGAAGQDLTGSQPGDVVLRHTSASGRILIGTGSAIRVSLDSTGLYTGPPIFPSSAGASIRAGSGSPEGVVTANVGSIFMRTDGGAGTSIYVKESGTGNTGWSPK